MSKLNKIQLLIIKYLLDNGSIELLLPDGIKLEIGITQENEEGDLEIMDDYCYVITAREDKKTILDSYNLSLQFFEEKDTIIFKDEMIGDDGEAICTLEVI